MPAQLPGLLVLSGLAALPALACAQDAAIATVTITASKDAVVRKVDKTVVDVTAMARAQSGTAQDVLQSTPELSVGADGRIAVRGNTNVTVLVDGKPSAMLAGDERAVALQSMNGADIASVEVITNPSAAYNANGGAIVNLVLKRHRQPGAHAQLRASAADQGLWNTGASGDITMGKLSMNGSVAYRRDGTQKFRQSSVDWRSPQDGQTGQAVQTSLTGQTRQTSAVFVRRTVQSAGLGIDYALSASDSLNLSAHHNQRRSRPWLDVLNEDVTGAESTMFHRISSGPNEQADHDASLAYTRQRQPQGWVLKAVLARSSTRSLVDKSYRDVFVPSMRASGDSRGATRAAHRLDQATLDWTRASAPGEWSMGLDLQDDINHLANYQALVDRAAGTETPDPATTNGYTLASRLTAAYLTDKIRRGRWEVLLGGRLERMALRITPLQGGRQTGHWQAFNPSLHGLYALRDHIDLTLGYRRSLQRPDARDFNPFTTYLDAHNLSRGNPGLQPQRLTAWELGANLKAGRVTASIGAFHRLSRDTVIDARSVNADQVLLTSRQNGGRARATGINGSLDWTLSAALRLGLDGGVYDVRLETPDLHDQVRQRDMAGYVKLRAAYHAGPNDLSLDAQWQSAGITPLGDDGATSSVNATWKRALTATLSLTLNANDIFDGSRRSYATEASHLRQRGVDHFVARRWYVGLVKKWG